MQRNHVTVEFFSISEIVLDTIVATAEFLGGDVLAAIIYLATQQSNSGGVSVFAVSNGLGLPYETTRRRFYELECEGWIVKSQFGWSTSTPKAAGERQVDYLRKLHSINCRSAVSVTASHCPQGQHSTEESELKTLLDAARIFSRAPLRAVEYGLKNFETVTDAIIYLALMNLTAAGQSGLTLGTDMPDDAARCTVVWDEEVTSSEVASRLGMHRETVRRRLTALATLGRCSKSTTGYRASPAFIKSAEMKLAWAKTVDAFEQARRELARLDAPRPGPSVACETRRDPTNFPAGV